MSRRGASDSRSDAFNERTLRTMLTASAARRLLSSSIGYPLAGFARRAARGALCDVEDDPLEINAVVFTTASAPL